MRYKMAIVSPAFLPVPAVDGGAVEVLTTYLIDENEKKPQYDIDVYTVPSPKLDTLNYRYSNIIQAKCPKSIYWGLKVLNKIRNNIYKCFKIERFYYVEEYLLAWKIRNKEYDVVVIQNNMNMYELVYKYSPNKNNLVYHIHNDVGTISKNARLCYLIADTSLCVFAVSQYIRNRFITEAKKVKDDFNQEKIKTLYNCVDMLKFRCTSLENTVALRKKYGLDPKDIVVLFSGRITKEKGVKELIQAFTKIDDEFPVKLLIVGDAWFGRKKADPYMVECADCVEVITNRVIFTGYIYPKDMPKVYQVADIVAIPSIWQEPFGVVALEAMASKKAIIATKSGGMAEVLDGVSWLLTIDDNLSENLAIAIRKLASDSAKRSELGLLAYERVAERHEYHLSNYFNRFSKLINQFMQKERFNSSNIPHT